MTAPKVFFYVQHLLGIGHLARASRITRALIDAGMTVTLVTGGRPVQGFPGPGITHVALPSVAVSDGDFAGLMDEAGKPVDAAFEARRTALLLAAYHAAAPDIVITEAYPFGRRQVRFELRPLIAAIEASVPRPKLVASVRDILQSKVKPGRNEETVAAIRAHYDLVLVHGDPAFAPLEATFALADQISDKVAYTGLVCPPPPPLAAQAFDVIVSAGGGAVGADLVQAAVAAAALLPDLAAWCVITGPNMAQADYDRLARAATPNVTLQRFRADFASLLSGARLSVSQAGYNTVGDILQAGCRALLVPYATQGETEQTERAERLAQIGRAQVLTEADLTGPALAAAITRTLAQPLSSISGRIAVDGAARTAQILSDLVSGLVSGKAG